MTCYPGHLTCCMSTHVCCLMFPLKALALKLHQQKMDLETLNCWPSMPASLMSTEGGKKFSCSEKVCQINGKKSLRKNYEKQPA